MVSDISFASARRAWVQGIHMDLGNIARGVFFFSSRCAWDFSPRRYHHHHHHTLLSYHNHGQRAELNRVGHSRRFPLQCFWENYAFEKKDIERHASSSSHWEQEASVSVFVSSVFACVLLGGSAVCLLLLTKLVCTRGNGSLLVCMLLDYGGFVLS